MTVVIGIYIYIGSFLFSFFLVGGGGREKFFAKNLSRVAGWKGGVRAFVPGYDIGRPVIDGNWKFDWQVFDMAVADLKPGRGRK